MQEFIPVHIIDNTSELLVVLYHPDMGHAAYAVRTSLLTFACK